MNKHKKSLGRRIKRLKRLYRLKKKKMIIMTAAYSAIAVICFGILVSAGKNEPVFISTADSDTTANPTQITDMHTESTSAPNENEHNIEWINSHNFNINYCDFFGVDMSAIEKNMGTPDKYGDNYMVYKNILFDIYSADAVFYFNNYRLESALIKFLDTENRKTVISNFQSICGILIDQYGEPVKKTETFYDFTKDLYGHSLWDNSCDNLYSLIELNVSNPNANFDMILTYSNPFSSFCFNTDSLENLINDTPEQPTEAPTKPVNSSTFFFVSRDYGEYWGCDTTDIISEFGTPDESNENQLIYKNVMYADMSFEYSAELIFDFNNNGELCMITVNLRSIGNDYLRTYNIKIGLTYEYGEPDDERRGYKTWITPKSQIELHGPTITYTPN